MLLKLFPLLLLINQSQLISGNKQDSTKNVAKDASDKRMENEEIEFKEPPIQEAVKKRSISQSIGGDNSSNNLHIILFYYLYSNSRDKEGKICLFDSHTYSVDEIAKFHNYYDPFQVATTQNKIFAIASYSNLFEIFDLNTRQISKGPDPPEWRNGGSVTYFKGKLYYLGGSTNRVDVLIDGEWQTGPTFPLPIAFAQAITCDGILYVIDGFGNRKIYRLSDDELEWTEIGEIPEGRGSFEVASLNEKIYITGGSRDFFALNSCLCFDPSAPVDSRISRIADMNYGRHQHSHIVANGKLYAIGGFHDIMFHVFCNSIEEYNPKTDKWREVEKIHLQIGGDNLFNNLDSILFYHFYSNNNGKYEGRIGLFNSFTYSVEEIAKFHNYYRPFQVATTQNKIFAIASYSNLFEIFDLNTRQFSRGPAPPEWRDASVAYFKDKLYYLGGNTNRVDVLIDGRWQTGPKFPFSINLVQTVTCDEILYVIDGFGNRKIYRLLDDEREWIEIGEIPETRGYSGIASLNGKIYITGGWKTYNNTFKSCLCFDPSAPVGSRISRIADMNYERHEHSLIVANGKLYAIGGLQKVLFDNFRNSIEEYDPQANRWEIVEKEMNQDPKTPTSSTPTSSTDYGKITLIISIPMVFVLSIIFVVCTIYYRRKHIDIFISNHLKNSKHRNEYINCSDFKEDAWAIKQSEVEIYEDRLLGKGAFSEVYVGVVSGRIPLFSISRNIEVHLHPNSKKDVVEVAMKRLQGHASDRDHEDFYREIEIMKRLEYNLHIVSMYGYVPSKFIPLMILEHCELGDILKYLIDNEESFKSGTISIKEITSFAWQVCDGMSYVASKDIVHRDLAARNVLLTKGHKAKISDFGLAIKSDESDKVVRGLLPLKWTAPEAFTNSEFSSKSDVWSFGVTLYEFYSLGQRPYHDIAPSDLMAHLREGNRLPKPELCPDEMYELMEKCWSINPEGRLSFDELKSEISKCLLMITNYYGYLETHEDSDSDNLSDICPVSTILE